jgi:predicted nucleic acid-binding protein
VLSEKLGYTQEQIEAVHALLSQLACEHLPSARVVEAITGDRADDAILACAAEATADVLATGDRRHLLPVGEYRDVRIRTPQQLLAEFRAS